MEVVIVAMAGMVKVTVAAPVTSCPGAHHVGPKYVYINLCQQLFPNPANSLATAGWPVHQRIDGADPAEDLPKTPNTPRGSDLSGPLATAAAAAAAATTTAASAAPIKQVANFASKFYLSHMTLDANETSGAVTLTRLSNPLRRLLERHWEKFGRHFAIRLDYVALKPESALEMFERLQIKIRSPIVFVHAWFHYGPHSYQVGTRSRVTDPVRLSQISGRGLRSGRVGSGLGYGGVCD